MELKHSTKLHEKVLKKQKFNRFTNETKQWQNGRRRRSSWRENMVRLFFGLEIGYETQQI